MRRAAAPLLACLAVLQAMPVGAAGAAWQPVASVPGIFDVGGPTAGSRLVVAGAGRLYLLDQAGAVTPFAQGPGGYADDKGGEAYLAVSPGLHPGGAGCDFQPGDVTSAAVQRAGHFAVVVVDTKGKVLDAYVLDRLPLRFRHPI